MKQVVLIEQVSHYSCPVEVGRHCCEIRVASRPIEYPEDFGYWVPLILSETEATPGIVTIEIQDVEKRIYKIVSE